MDYIRIGKIVGTHGLDGNITIAHNLDKNPKLKKLKHFFIEIKRESYIPYFVEQIHIDNHQEIFVKLEEVDSIEDAKALNGKNVYLDAKQYEQLNPAKEQINFEGFLVFDINAGKLATIDGLFETPGQLLATLQMEGKEVIIPLNDSTIKDVDIQKRSLIVELPDGLLDIYLKA